MTSADVAPRSFTTRTTALRTLVLVNVGNPAASSVYINFDFHTWLAAQPGDDRATRSVVIEFTPRVRAGHPTWTLQALESLARQKTRVRISGWTMLDPEHPDEVGKSRGTIWEIHPVMRVETQQGSGWKEL